MEASSQNISLIPFREFAKRVPKILVTTKRESDKQLAAFKAANAKRREAKKKKR